ncbi:hypothetical protein V1525DRAFT_397723 [Lipomyces kononenkoae]|uniref:Uncharacterized protein n=1 Tax=Lipomyces kononenkoae TaxID=34357 RepID=A0ACC3T7F2_LIPKO
MTITSEEPILVISPGPFGEKPYEAFRKLSFVASLTIGAFIQSANSLHFWLFFFTTPNPINF